MKQADEHGFVFFTNYNSQKARELDANPQAALVFYWPQLERQVRVEGRVERISAAESDAYFKTRPRESQLGAAASPQSEVVASREVLEQRFRELEEVYEGREVERPEHWGGYRLSPERIEFWKGRPAGCTIELFTSAKRAGAGRSSAWRLNPRLCRLPCGKPMAFRRPSTLD